MYRSLCRFFLISAAGMLAACATSPSSDSAPAATLSAYHWDLAQAHDRNGAPQPGWAPPATRQGQPLRLSFADGRVSVSGLCNRLGASYTLQGSKISISPVVGTMMACPEAAVMQYEQALGQRLPHAATWRIDQGQGGPALTLTFNDGATWTLAGTPTDQTRFGTAGQTLFMEVSAQRIPCSHPLMPGKQCLQVREVRFDAQGLKTGHGEWQAFYDEIEGYTHEPGIRNVLRVKRYERPQAPADASRYAYVLDMVVESARE